MLLFVALKIAPENSGKCSVKRTETKSIEISPLLELAQIDTTLNLLHTGFPKNHGGSKCKTANLAKPSLSMQHILQPENQCGSGLKPVVEQISYASRYALSKKQRSFCATAKYRGLWLCSGGE
jgi:hypothetical protein